MVYGRSWRVVCLPVILWFGSLICTVLVVYYEILYATSVTTQDYSSASRAYTKAADTTIGIFSSNIATNVFSTGMTIPYCFVM